jgi:hypothetical protein
MANLPEGPSPQAVRARRDKILLIFFVVEIVCLTLLQKIGYAPSPDSSVGLCLLAMLVGIAVVGALVPPIFDPVKLGLFFAFLLTASLSTFLQKGTYSSLGFILMLLCYVPFLMTFPISKATHRKALNIFSTIMIVGGALAIAEDLVQYAASWRLWPNLDLILPEKMLVSGYVYVQKISPFSIYMKPNGVFFLEVSFLSQFTAIALALELIYFRRAWRLAFFGVVLISCFAGTGLMLLGLTLPVLMGRLSIRSMTMIIVLLTVAGLVAVVTGWYDQIAPRITEYQHHGSSANFRFVEPYIKLLEFSKTPSALYLGIGPGNISKAANYIWWPVTKAAVEYGYLAAALFYSFFLYAMFKNAPDRKISFMLCVWFSIMGGLAVPVNTLTCALLCSLFKVEEGRQRRRRSSATDGGSASAAAMPAAVA